MHMLGYVSPEGRGAADRLLADAADTLRARGARLVGAVQVNLQRPQSHRHDMELHVLTGHDVIRISQYLGRDSRGCHLDPDGLERTVGLVEAALEKPADLLIVNKFGKQEVEGRGFRPLIGQAMAAGIPVLTAVNPSNRPAFLDFTGGIATELAATRTAILDWYAQASTPSSIALD